jgi:hypothetical protein
VRTMKSKLCAHGHTWEVARVGLKPQLALNFRKEFTVTRLRPQEYA